MAKMENLDITIASEDQEDETSNWVDCSRELAVASFSHFNDFRSCGHMCDIIIRVEESSFRAHKVVLASTIPYFARMFTTQMIEARSDSVFISTINTETMEAILNFVYTGRIRFTSRNMERLLRAADYLQLSVLSNRCSEILKSKITEKNVFSIRRFALVYNVPQAVVDTDRFIQRYFIAVSRTEEFIQLDFQMLLQILDWDQLHVDSEEQVFEAAISWLEFDPSQRQVFAPRLLTAVRMPLLRPAFLIDEVSKNALLWNSMECRDLIDEAKNFHLVPERRAHFHTNFKTAIRVCTEVPGTIYVLGGITQFQPTPSAVEKYDPVKKKWTQGRPMLTQRTRIGVAMFDYKIYVVGGYNGNERLKSAEVYDTRSDKWSVLPSMLKRRSAMCAIAIGEQIYVCGGYDGAQALDSVESFDIRQNRWVQRSPMLASRCAAATAVVRGQIYVIGGHNGVSIFNTVERYDPIAERWEKVAPMQQPRCRLSAATYQNKIYAVGGYNNGTFVNTAEIYDPDTNQWASIQSMNLNRARVSLVTNGDLLYAIGGYDGENNLLSMEIYSPAHNKWENGVSMTTHEGGVGAVVVPASPGPPSKDPRFVLKRPMNGQSDEGPSEKRDGDSSVQQMVVDSHGAGPSTNNSLE